MAVAGLLAQYMSIKSQLSYVQLQDTRWNNMATAMSKKLSEMEKYEEKWESQSETASENYVSDEKSVTLDGQTIKQKGMKGAGACISGWQLDVDQFAEKYASAKVKKFDPDKLEEYTDLDMEYSAMVAMYDTLLEELKAQADGTKQQLSTEAQDNHMLGGS